MSGINSSISRAGKTRRLSCCWGSLLSLVLFNIATWSISGAATASPLEERKASLVLLGVRTLSEILGHVEHKLSKVISVRVPPARPEVTFLIQFESSYKIVSQPSGLRRHDETDHPDVCDKIRVRSCWRRTFHRNVHTIPFGQGWHLEQRSDSKAVHPHCSSSSSFSWFAR